MGSFSLCQYNSGTANVLDEYPIAAEVRAALLKNINRRLTPQAVKIRADLEVTCFAYDGIDAIKEALKAGEALGNADMPIKVHSSRLSISY
jgi:translation initiation factor 2 subunit 1